MQPNTIAFKIILSEPKCFVSHLTKPITKKDNTVLKKRYLFIALYSLKNQSF